MHIYSSDQIRQVKWNKSGLNECTRSKRRWPSWKQQKLVGPRVSLFTITPVQSEFTPLQACKTKTETPMQVRVRKA